MFPASGSSLVEVKAFKGVGRDNQDGVGDIIFRIQGHFEVGKDAGEEISVWERRGSTYVGYAIHVIDYKQGIIDRVARHKTIDSFKGYFIVGLYREVFEVKDPNKDIVK